MLSSYVITFLLGALVGFGELLNRYRNPGLVFKVATSVIYLLINGMASALTYYIMDQYNLWFDGFTSKEIGKIAFSGLSAMFFLRSSVFVYKPKDSDTSMNIGIASFIQIFLDFAERSFDQNQSIVKLNKVRQIMQDIDFELASKDLSLLCLALMKNVSMEEQQKLAEDIQKLTSGGLKFVETKSVSLGILISDVAGVELLEVAVETLKAKISLNGEDTVSLQQAKLQELQDKLVNN
jgi:hypothetical protein